MEFEQAMLYKNGELMMLEGYLVNKEGVVKKESYIDKSGNRRKGFILKKYIKKSGYVEVSIMINSKMRPVLLHRIVASTFVPNLSPEILKEVNHKNGDKADCRTENLEWVTPKGNIQHADNIGLRNIEKMRKLSVDDVVFIKTNYKRYSKEFGMVALAKKFGVCYATIQDILNGKCYNWVEVKEYEKTNTQRIAE